MPSLKSFIKPLDKCALCAYNVNVKFKELEKLIKVDGWMFEQARGSHYHYIHPAKKGKVTIPHHGGDIPVGTLNSILKQAGLKK